MDKAINEKIMTNIDILTAKNEINKLFNEELVKDKKAHEENERTNTQFDEKFKETILNKIILLKN